MYDKDTLVNKAVNEFTSRYDSELNIIQQKYLNALLDKENKENMEKSLNSFLFDASLKEFRIHSFKYNIEILLNYLEENMWAYCGDESDLKQIIFEGKKREKGLSEREQSIVEVVTKTCLRDIEKIGLYFNMSQLIEEEKDGDIHSHQEYITGREINNRNSIDAKLLFENHIMSNDSNDLLYDKYKNLIFKQIKINDAILDKIVEGAAFFKRIIPSVGRDTFVINDLLNNDSENNTIHALIANGIYSNPSLPLGAFIAMDEKMGSESVFHKALLKHLVENIDVMISKNSDYNQLAEYLLKNKNMNADQIMKYLIKADIEIFENNTNKKGLYRLKKIGEKLFSNELSDYIVKIKKFYDNDEIEAIKEEEYVNKYIFDKNTFLLITNIKSSFLNHQNGIISFTNRTNEGKEEIVVRVVTNKIDTVSAADTLELVKEIYSLWCDGDVNKVLTREDGERTLREIQLKKQIKSSGVSNLETRVRGKL